MKKKFKREDLQACLYGKHRGFEVISDEIFDTSRWSIYHYLVFKHDDKFYQVNYSVGATEYQDESPFEYDGDEIECEEVHQVEKLVKVWEAKDE